MTALSHRPAFAARRTEAAAGAPPTTRRAVAEAARRVRSGWTDPDRVLRGLIANAMQQRLAVALAPATAR